MSSNPVVINCLDKTICIVKQLMPIDSFMSNSIVFVITCLKSLVKGAQGYMLLFYVKVEVENDVLAIPVVCKFQERQCSLR